MKFLITLVFVVSLVTIMFGAFGDLEKACSTNVGRVVVATVWFATVITLMCATYP